MSRAASGSSKRPPGGVASPDPLDHKERLRLALPAAAELLRLRQAGRIDASDIDAFVDLNWLEWHGGSLRLTETGSNVCSQLALARRG
jgi:hypothetical protein